MAAVHDASRDFHIALASASGQPRARLTLEGLWLSEVGRRLLAARTIEDGWQHTDADEHAAILVAVRDDDADLAEALTHAHVRDALRHWQDGNEGTVP